jgi:hypothetical protein
MNRITPQRWLRLPDRTILINGVSGGLEWPAFLWTIDTELSVNKNADRY